MLVSPSFYPFGYNLMLLQDRLRFAGFISVCVCVQFFSVCSAFTAFHLYPFDSILHSIQYIYIYLLILAFIVSYLLVFSITSSFSPNAKDSLGLFFFLSLYKIVVFHLLPFTVRVSFHRAFFPFL